MHKASITELKIRRDKLKANEHENANIVKKLNRQIRKLEK